MADVVIVFVREDAALAEALAEMFDEAGLEIDDQLLSEETLPEVGAGVLLWSQAATESPTFMEAAHRLIGAGKAVVANLTDAPLPRLIGASPAFDFSDWDEDSDESMLEPLCAEVEHIVTEPAETDVAPPPPPPRPEVKADPKPAATPFWSPRAQAPPPSPPPPPPRPEPAPVAATNVDVIEREDHSENEDAIATPPLKIERPRTAKRRSAMRTIAAVFSIMVLAALGIGGFAATGLFGNLPATQEPAPRPLTVRATQIIPIEQPSQSLEMAEITPLRVTPLQTAPAQATPPPAISALRASAPPHAQATHTAPRPATTRTPRRARTETTPPPVTSWDREASAPSAQRGPPL